LGHFVPLELVLNFIIPCLAGRIFFTGSAPHLDGSAEIVLRAAREFEGIVFTPVDTWTGLVVMSS
jgi:hypothetical protein